jgi:hypothetical protein
MTVSVERTIYPRLGSKRVCRRSVNGWRYFGMMRRLRAEKKRLIETDGGKEAR